MDFDLVYRIDGHRDTGAPRLDLSLNGTFVGRLPTDGKEGSRRKRIRLQRDHFRGYNEFLVHISYPEGSCGAGEPVVVLEQETTLRLEKARNFAPLPDVKLLAYDGFPFTRHADLSHTVIALPESPTVAEVSSALSWIAWFAAITGEGGTSPWPTSCGWSACGPRRCSRRSPRSFRGSSWASLRLGRRAGS